jgi:hypothetical protein
MCEPESSLDIEDEKGEPLGNGRSQHATVRFSKRAVTLLRGIRDGTFSRAECGTWETFEDAGCNRSARHKGNRGRAVIEGVGEVRSSDERS